MAKGLFLALSLLVVSVAKAVMVTWSVPAWDNSWLQTGNVDVYLVSSGTANNPTDPSKDWESSGNWDVDKGQAGENLSQVTPGQNQTNFGKIIDGQAHIYADVGDLTSGYIYSLVFVIKEGDQAGHYAMTQGVRYNLTDTGASEGYYIAAADGKEPSLADFLDVGWSANNNVRGTPEPTALALLAFGIAGLALRRQIHG